MSIDAIDLITCEIVTSDGVIGLGYTYTLQRGGQAIHAMLQHEIAPELAGRRVERPESLWNELWRACYRFGRGGVLSVALAAADVAIWDAVAKTAGLPLYQFLGTHRSSIRVYGSSIDLGYSEEELLATVQNWLDRGFQAVKIKVGRSLREDIQRLTAVRDLIGPDTTLMVDANNGWDLPEATRRVRPFEQFDLTWLEEPLDADDIRGHALLQQHTTIPIAAGETLFSVAEFSRYLDANALLFPQPDTGRLGGITPWLRVANLAHARSLPIAPHFLQDQHVHLLCAIPNGWILEYLPLLDELIEEPLQVRSGMASPPDRPGLGVSFRQDALRHYQVARSETHHH